MNEFYIDDKYGYKEYDYLTDLLNFALKKLNINDSLFSIILTDNEEIQFLNKNYRGIDSVTDVISFALNDNGIFPGPLNVLGDIYISIPKMKSQALEYKHSEKRELSFLALHGLLHLLGYDHMNLEDENIMFGLQKEILNEAGIQN